MTVRRTSDPKILEQQYSEKRHDWKELYQWTKTESKGNTEIIAGFLLNDFDKIGWSCAGLRKDKFNFNIHQGQMQLQTEITQFTEKRFCRALYNTYRSEEEQSLGKIIDYEIPLSQPQKDQKKEDRVYHGDIDLLSFKNNELLFIEAKAPNKNLKQNHSLLKAILEIFYYVMILKKCGRLSDFVNEYVEDDNIKITPCVLTFFKVTTSGEQLKNINDYPNLIKLIDKINRAFNANGINELKYYIVEKPDTDFPKVLKDESLDGRNFFVTFNKEIKISQYLFPK